METITVESIVNSIVKQSGKSRVDVLKEIDKLIVNTGGLLTKVGSAIIIADRLHVNIDNDNPVNDPVDLGNLVVGMKDIVVIGKVMRIFPVKTFSKRDGTTGKIVNVLIRDISGDARVAFWNDRCDETASMKIGDVLKLTNVSTKNEWNGIINVNINKNSMIQINPEGTTVDVTQPSIIPIKDISKSMKYCNTVVTVEKKMDPREFVKKDGSTGRLAKMFASDETGNVTIVFWMKRVDDFEMLEKGKKYEIDNVNVKYNDYRDELELHVNASTTITER